MAKAYMFLSNGFEEVEALAVVDLLRRGKVDITTVSISKKQEVEGAHGIKVLADTCFEEDAYFDGDMIILPGGGKGTNGLMGHEGLRELLYHYRDEEKYIGAICAAPSVLGMNGLLKNRRATCYPGFEDKLLGAKVTNEAVVVDGNIITAKAMGVTNDFGLKLLEILCGKEEADNVKNKIFYE